MQIAHLHCSALLNPHLPLPAAVLLPTEQRSCRRRCRLTHATRRPPARPPPQLELELQTPGLLARLASAVPGLQQQLSLASAWHRLLNGLLDDAAAFVVALVAYHQLPPLLAGREAAAAMAA